MHSSKSSSEIIASVGKLFSSSQVGTQVDFEAMINRVLCVTAKGGWAVVAKFPRLRFRR